jgi:uncharacterized protein (TIGR03083 family)
MIEPPEPILTTDLFGEDRAALLALLAELTEADWEQPTACTGWTVKDVTLHLLGVDLGNLSNRRDRFAVLSPATGEPIVAFVNRVNDEWMRAARRLSTPVVRELLAVAGPPLFAYFASLDQLALGNPVSWAGPDPAPVWLDVAREFTERWHHQQHIRDAVGRPGQTTRRFLYPVLAAFAHALPKTFHAVEAPIGAMAQLHVTGEAGGDWTVGREASGWRLYVGGPESALARVTLDSRTAWRLFTKGITPGEAREVATIEGDHHLAERKLQVVALIA